MLRFYIKKWEQYHSSSKIINKVCWYLNEHWLQQQYDSGRGDVYDVFTVS